MARGSLPHRGKVETGRQAERNDAWLRRAQSELDGRVGRLEQGVLVFVSDTPPVTDEERYLWVDTSVDPPVLYVEDGV